MPDKDLRARILDVLIYGNETMVDKPTWMAGTLDGEGQERSGGWDVNMLSHALKVKRVYIQPELDYLVSIGRINRVGTYYWYSKCDWNKK